jgi:hypothetical protein
MYPHRIRLRGPWECETREQKARVTMPCRWREAGWVEFRGQVRCRRRFGYPGRIDAHERVWLTFAGVADSADIWLNGQLLGHRERSDCPFEFDVTAVLQARNELLVEVISADDRGGLEGEVALEIRCAAYLRSVRLEVSRVGEAVRVTATGQVVGVCERPLELYLIVDRSTAAYATVEASPEGQPFHLVSEEVGIGREESPTARVELVNVGTVWYTVEMSLRA